MRAFSVQTEVKEQPIFSNSASPVSLNWKSCTSNPMQRNSVLGLVPNKDTFQMYSEPCWWKTHDVQLSIEGELDEIFPPLGFTSLI